MATFSILPSPKVSETIVEVRIYWANIGHVPHILIDARSHIMPCFHSISLSTTVISLFVSTMRLCQWCAVHFIIMINWRIGQVRHMRQESENSKSKLWQLEQRPFLCLRIICTVDWYMLTFQLVAQVMCGVSTSLRFPGQLNGYVMQRCKSMSSELKYSLQRPS